MPTIHFPADNTITEPNNLADAERHDERLDETLALVDDLLRERKAGRGRSPVQIDNVLEAAAEALRSVLTR